MFFIKGYLFLQDKFSIFSQVESIISLSALICFLENHLSFVKISFTGFSSILFKGRMKRCIYGFGEHCGGVLWNKEG